MNWYLNNLKLILEEGVTTTNRTGTNTISYTGLHSKVPVSEDAFPLITTRKVPYKSIFAELIWLISGAKDVKDLQDHGYKFWDSWADKNGILETSYARYWRHYPMPMGVEKWLHDGQSQITKVWKDGEPFIFDVNYVSNFGNIFLFDQFKWVIDELRRNPQSRRLIVTAWYPPNAAVSKLPCCHHTWQLKVNGDKLDLILLQRSGDYPVGVVFNTSCYSALLLLIAREVGLKPGHFQHFITDAHIYEDQIEGVKEQLEREPFSLPSIKLPKKSLFELTMADVDNFEIINYITHPPIKYPVAI